MKNTDGLRGHLAALFTILVWGTTYISSKVLLRSFTLTEVAFLRYLVAYGALWLVWPHRLRLPNRRDELLFAGAGLCGITLYSLFEMAALARTMTANVSVIVSTAPFFTTILCYVLLGEEKPRALFYAGFALAIGGIVLISLGTDGGLAVSPVGDFLALAAAIVWSFYCVLMKRITALGCSTFAATRRVFFYALIFMLPEFPVLGFSPDWSALAAPHNWLNLLYLGLIASAVCYASWNFAIRRLGPTRTSVYIYLMPVVTLVASLLLLGEIPSRLSLLGILLTLTGLLLSQVRIPPVPENGLPPHVE